MNTKKSHLRHFNKPVFARGRADRFMQMMEVRAADKSTELLWVSKNAPASKKLLSKLVWNWIRTRNQLLGKEDVHGFAFQDKEWTGARRSELHLLVDSDGKAGDYPSWLLGYRVKILRTGKFVAADAQPQVAGV